MAKGHPRERFQADRRVADEMTDDEWLAHRNREAAKEIGTWLEARGKLHQPIRCLTMADLEAMASNAIARWIVLSSNRLAAHPDSPTAEKWLLSG